MRETSERAVARRIGPDPGREGDGSAGERAASARLRALRPAAREPRGEGASPAVAGPYAKVPLIDREREMAALRGALAAAHAGDGHVALVGGEPGIGKTRLARAAADEAAALGMAVWWGRGWEDGAAPAFWPWRMGLRRWQDQVGRDVVCAATGGWTAELAHVFPALREDEQPQVAGRGDEPESSMSGRWDAPGARFRLFDIVSRFLAAVARPAGLLVVLDDVHWADLPSLRLLELVAATLAESRILIVATYRDTELRPDDAWAGTLTRLVRDPSTLRLSLAGLSASHCARWLTLCGARGDVARQGEALHRETNGNPFFVGELVRLLAADGTPPTGWDARRVPQGVQAVIARRLDRLGLATRAALGVAALLGDVVDAAILGEVLDDPALPDHLERAVRDRILVAGEGRPEEHVFAHTLIRRVLVDELPPSARGTWHVRIATVLERRAAASPLATTALVRHLAAGGTPDALRRAFEWACRGAEEAARGLGWEEAARLYEIALDVGRRSGLLDVARATELRLALARALRAAGDVGAARACCDEVMTACRRTPDPDAFARAALIHAGPMPEWGRVEPAVRAVLEEACRAGATVSDGLRARLYARLAGDLVAADEIAQGPRVFALCADAAAAARRAGAEGALAIALTGTYYAAAIGMHRGEHEVAVPCTQAMLDAAQAGGEHEWMAAIRYARCMTLFGSCEAEAFSAEVDGLAAAAAASHAPEMQWLADALAALRATVQGRFAEARDLMERARSAGCRLQVPNAVGIHGSQRIMWHAFQGRLAEAASEIEAFVDGHPVGASWRPLRALARLARGDVVAARTELHELLPAGIASAGRGVMARCHLAGLAALCIALREREHAQVLYDCLAERADAWSADGCQTLGPWALLSGGLARLCGRPADAARHFEESIQLGRRLQSPPVVARAQSQLASLQLAGPLGAEERERVAAMLAEAAQSAAACGLADVTARVERLRAKLVQGPLEESNGFRWEGEVWSVRHAGLEVRVRDGKGPRYLAALLAAPGRELHVLQFLAPAPGVAGPPEGLAVGVAESGLDDAPDAPARRAYRARLAELREELDEAERFADAGRGERLRAELDHLTAQLAERFGGRTRRRGHAETARKAVTKVLRTQIARLLEIHPAVGRHLRDTVRMGTVCVYTPASPIAWDVVFPTP